MARKLHIRVLDEAIANPNADGRKRGWNGAKTFEPGRYIMALGVNHPDFADGRPIHACKAGCNSYDNISIYREAEALAALWNATKPAEPEGIFEIVAIATGHDDGSGARDLLGVLLQQGVITAEQIIAAQDALDDDEDLYDRI